MSYLLDSLRWHARGQGSSPLSSTLPNTAFLQVSGVTSEQPLLGWSDPKGSSVSKSLYDPDVGRCQAVAQAALTVVVFARGLRGLAVDLAVAEAIAPAGPRTQAPPSRRRRPVRSRRIRGFRSSAFKFLS